MIYEKNEGTSVIVNIENIDEKDPYTVIASKAFLSCKNVCEITLPATICEIGDWAFAHMKELRKITLPANDIAIGRDAFLDCNNLKEIVVDYNYPEGIGNHYSMEGEKQEGENRKSDESDIKTMVSAPIQEAFEGLSYLLASCVTVFNNYDLLDFKSAAEQSIALEDIKTIEPDDLPAKDDLSAKKDSWSKRYDEELLKFIKAPDDRGFKFYIVGWFDDDSEEEQRATYINKIRSEKLELSFLRLKYDTYIEEDTRVKLVEYIRRQLEYGDETGLIEHRRMAWTLFRDELSDDLQYVKIVVNNDMIDADQKSELIEYINKRNGNPEIVSYLLSLEEDRQSLEQLFEL